MVEHQLVSLPFVVIDRSLLTFKFKSLIMLICLLFIIKYGSSYLIVYRDQNEKTWRPTFMCLHNSPHNNYTFHEKPTKIRL